jgi:A/G-specific adenine glycosylase
LKSKANQPDAKLRRDFPADFLQALTKWLEKNKRPLPWRGTKDPYLILVSEVMAQQTRAQVAAVRWPDFVDRFPDLERLAAAESESVLKAWEGLGYYGRAKNLHKAAKAALAAGGLPNSFEGLLKLPGIGPYTAAAIASICYGEKQAAIDANALRVASRVLALWPLDRALAKTAYEEAMGDLDPGASNEAVMELGETLCTPKSPACEACPVQLHCLAHMENAENSFPLPKAHKAKRVESMTVFALSHQGLVALSKRPERGLLSEMRELPNASGFLSEEDAKKWLMHMGFESVEIMGSREASHIFSHIEWRMLVYEAKASPPVPMFAWASPHEISKKFALPTAFRKLL